jgi:hypothetical protein
MYLDSSVALAHLFTEGRRPTESLWKEPLVSSRLLVYEIWNRVHARRAEEALGEEPRRLLDLVGLVDLIPMVLARALEPFPAPVRTLDALHLSTALFLISRGQRLELATYDDRMFAAATALKIPTAGL